MLIKGLLTRISIGFQYIRRDMLKRGFKCLGFINEDFNIRLKGGLHA